MKNLIKLFILSTGLFVSCGHREHRDHKDTVLIYECKGNQCQCQTPIYPTPTPIPIPQYPSYPDQGQGQDQSGKVVVVVNSSSKSSSNSSSKSSSCNNNYNLFKDKRFERQTKCKGKKPCLSLGNWSYSEFNERDIDLEYDVNSCDNIESETIEN